MVRYHNVNVKILIYWFIYLILHSYVKQCTYITMWKIWFLLEEGERFHNVCEDKPDNITKRKSSKYTPTTNSYDFCKKVWSLKIYNKIIYKVRKKTIEPRFQNSGVFFFNFPNFAKVMKFFQKKKIYTRKKIYFNYFSIYIKKIQNTNVSNIFFYWHSEGLQWINISTFRVTILSFLSKFPYNQKIGV
jgi:hypothetical protein